MSPQNITDIYDFMAWLRGKGIKYFLSHERWDGISVNFALVGVRVEVEFTPTTCLFSYFTGPEDVFGDFSLLEKLVAENWDD